MSTNYLFDDSKIYQLGIINNGGINVIGSGTVESNAVRFFSTNQTDDFQQWTVVHVDTTPDYPYRWKVKRSGLFLSAKCDFTIGKDCTKGTVDRATLVPSQKPEDVPEAGWWNAVASDENDGSFRWYSKANGTDAWLDAIGTVVVMNRNTTAGVGGRWTMTSVGDIDPSATDNAPSSSTTALGSGSASARLSGGAIGGIVVGVIVGLLLIAGAVGFWFRRRNPNHSRDQAQQKYEFVQDSDEGMKPELDAYNATRYSPSAKPGYGVAESVELSTDSNESGIYHNRLHARPPAELSAV